MITYDGKNQEQENVLREYLEANLNYIYRLQGRGSFTSRYLMTLAKFNKLSNKIMEKNHEVAGYTFFTRPMLNLQEPSLKTDRITAMLNSIDPGTIAFSIRCYLDSMFTNGAFHNQKSMAYRGLARQCPYF